MSMRGAGPRDVARERAAAVARRNDVDAEMAERARARPPSATRDEAPESAPRDVLEEHALDGILRAEAEDLLALRLDRASRPSAEL